MSRYRLVLTPAQETALRDHCTHARFVWNLCVEQEAEWRPGRGKMPGFAERCRQLSEARADNPWLAAGSSIVQQQAIRDHAQAMRNFFAGTHRRPTWRKADRDEGFRIVAVKPGDVRRLNRKTAEVRIPKAGWVRFRLSRPVPEDVKSFRVTMDRAGRWHVAFAAIPDPVPAPGSGEVVGVDRGVTVSAALSTGVLLNVPHLSPGRQDRLKRLQRKLARARKGQRRVHEPAVLGVRARGCEVAREPSALRMHCLRFRRQRGRERGHQHRGGARRDCAGRPQVAGAGEPRTST